MSKTTLKERFGVATGIGVSGGLVAQAITQASPYFAGDFGFCRCAAAGAFLAGFVLASGFGRSGLGGWVLAAVTFVAATLIGAAVAVMFLPLEAFIASLDLPELALTFVGGLAMGPLYVVEMVTGKLGVLLLWVGSILGIHLLAQYLRDHRAKT